MTVGNLQGLPEENVWPVLRRMFSQVILPSAGLLIGFWLGCMFGAQSATANIKSELLRQKRVRLVTVDGDMRVVLNDEEKVSIERPPNNPPITHRPPPVPLPSVPPVLPSGTPTPAPEGTPSPAPSARP